MTTDPTEVFGPLEVGASISTINNEADVVVLPNGETVVVWTARISAQDIVHLQRFDANGATLGDAVELGEGSQAQIEVLADGGYAVAWNTRLELVGLRFDANGNDVTGSLTFSTYPTIPPLDPGTRIIVIPGTETIDRFGTEIFGQNTLSPSDILGNPGSTAFDGFALTALTGGGYVLTGSYFSGPDSGFDMFAMVYSATPGELIPVEVRLPDEIHPAASDQDNQQRALTTAALNDGGFVLVWRNDDLTGATGDELRLQRFDASGVAQGAPQTVATSTEGIFEPVVTTLADGGFVVTWAEAADDPSIGDGSNVHVQIYNADGTVRTPEYIATALPGTQLDPAVVALPQGGFVLSWSQFFTSTGEWEVFARGYTNDGTEIPALLSTGQFPLGLSLGLSYVDSALAVTANGELRVVWTEQALAGLDDERIFNNVELLGFTALDVPAVGPTGGPDLLVGTTGADTIDGLQGDDTIEGDAGFDLLIGGGGNDSISGGGGADVINAGADNDTVAGGNGPDLVFLNQGDDLYNDNGQGDALGQDTVFGGFGNDTILGGGGNDEFHGQDGDDSIQAGLGNDQIFGGNQADTLRGGEGNDTIFGGNGRDEVFLNQGDDLFNDNDQGGQFGSDQVFGGFGNDTIEGGGGDDLFRGGDDDDLINGRAGDDDVFGELGFDLLYGGAGDDLVVGGDQADTLFGGTGSDTLVGGNGRDLVFMGAGDDVFFDNPQGGAFGSDTITGGLGADTFIFGPVVAQEVITDFTVGEDQLNLSSGLTGGQSAAEVAAGGQVTATGVLLNFETGQSILLEGLMSTTGLGGDIEIV